MNGLSENGELAYKELATIIKHRSQKILERFERAIISNVTDSKLLEIMTDVINYWSSSKSTSRDLIRPALTSFSCEAVGGDPEVADDAGLMFTIASAGFGIHDDILDRSLRKHMRPTILGLHGIDGALLSGDLLLVKGWSVLGEIILKSRNPAKIAEIINEYASCSIEICEAELMETRCRRNLERDLDYSCSILWKAMAEAEACCKIGAIMGEGNIDEIKALAQFGRRLGFTYRLIDEIQDCLNLKGDLAHRLEYESVPIPLLYAAKSSADKCRRIKKIIEKANICPSEIQTLLAVCFETEAFEYIRKMAQENSRQAAKYLSAVRASDARKVLLLLNERAYTRITEMCV